MPCVELFEVPSQEVRLPPRAVEALAAHRPVAVTRYGRRLHVVLTEEQFSLLEPLLELLQEGGALSPELLRSNEDLALERALGEDREPTEAENAQIASLLAETGSS
jgi:PHD/YefM family antitoxin component YafN of YafNO toxin-antitoxin module